MIVLGEKWKSSEDRESGIIAVLDGDVVQRMWAGSGPGRDLLLVHLIDPDGAHWIMGRLRVHRDDRMWGSKDNKQQFRAVIGADVEDKAGAVAALVKAMHFASALQGIRLPVESIDGNGAGPRDVPVLMERMAEVLPGWEVSIVSQDV